jgi:hypothetical protein
MARGRKDEAKRRGDRETGRGCLKLKTPGSIQVVAMRLNNEPEIFIATRKEKYLKPHASSQSVFICG